MMSDRATSGTWGIRLLIRFFTIVLGVLIFWLLGFLMQDIVSIEGPNYGEIERRYIDFTLIQKQGDLKKEIENYEREIASKREQQQQVGDSSDNLQHTINQLLELQKLSIEKQIPLPESENAELSSSLSHFLDSQKSYQSLYQEISSLLSRKIALEDEKRQLDEDIEKKREPARAEFNTLTHKHRLLLAFFQLAILLPLLFCAGYVLIKWRGTIYFPLILAFGGATLVKTGIVVHDYFPSRCFKYAVTFGLLLVVGQLLIYLIRMIAYPKTSWLVKQYREAYERFLCPVCEYPIRIGPRKYLFWTRRTVNKILPQDNLSSGDIPYTCPSCGTVLYETCDHCHKIRHSLLSYCEHCGTEKEIA